MAIKSSIHIKPCNTKSSEAHNRRTAEYMRNIGESRIYIVSELSADNEQWVNPDFGNSNLQTHYDNIKRMVKEKTGRAMQEKERERKGKNGKIIKVAGCSPIREGVLLIKPDTTLADVKKFGEECQRRWGITPLQIFLHKDEGHWLNGQPDAGDKESFQIGEKWFKPNYHAHIVFDWMNHDTGKSRKLNDNDMMEMQTLASDILLMKRGQSKAETGKEHLERNDFIIEKQKADAAQTEVKTPESQELHTQSVTEPDSTLVQNSETVSPDQEVMNAQEKKSPDRKPQEQKSQNSRRCGTPCDVFRDGELHDCRKILPQDLCYMGRRTCPLRNNRFVQYSYYHFGHLLLCRNKCGQMVLGIPGAYDQQERFMANMFGFPYFKESRHIQIPGGTGGYWYRLIDTPDFNKRDGRQ